MKKIKIGLPRALTYYEDNIFWQSFLRKLDYKVVIGPPIDDDIINLGKEYIKENNCQAYLAYIGEVIYLERICDYVLITSIVNYQDNYECCPRIKSIYNTVKTLIPSEKILNNYIDYHNFQYRFIEIIKIGFKLTKNPIKIIYSYFYAKKKQKKYDLNCEAENRNKLNKPGKKVLIISQSYNLENSKYADNITDILKKNEIIYLLSSYLDKRIASSFSEYFADELKLKYESEAIGTLYYYQYQLAGIILLSERNCIISNLLNNVLILRKSRIPIINIKIDEDYQNKIQHFIDIIKKETNE